MFFQRIIRWLLGFVRFRAEGGSPERFLTNAAHAGILLWNIRKCEDNTLQASTLAKNFKRLRPVAAQSGAKLTALRCGGLPFRTKKYRRRWGVLLGALLFIGTLWFFSSFIWTVEVSGNTATSSEEITGVLAELGLRPGAFPLLLNPRQIERQALLKLPDLAWITININGSEAQVRVQERRYPPDIVPQGTPCDIVAAQTGQIVKLEVYSGQPLLRVGDTVVQGETIIAGAYTDKNGIVTLMHAGGKAVARTARELTVTVPFRQRVKAPAGSPVERKTLNLFSFSIPLYFSRPHGDISVTIDTAPLTIAGMRLPVSLTTRTFRTLKETDVVYTRTQAAQMAADELKRQEGIELAGVTILQKDTQPTENEQGYTLRATYRCEEDIAVEQAITAP